MNNQIKEWLFSQMYDLVSYTHPSQTEEKIALIIKELEEMLKEKNS